MDLIQDQDQKIFKTIKGHWFLIFCIISLVYFIYRIIEPFLIQIFLAIVLAIIAEPLYNKVLNNTKNIKSLASFITCLILILIFAIPLFLMISLITSQALDLYTTVTTLLTDSSLESIFQDGLYQFKPYLEQFKKKFGISHSEILQQIGNLIKQISSLLYENLTHILKGVTHIISGITLIMFITFYLFMDGTQITKKTLSLSPLPYEVNNKILKEILHTLKVTLAGTLILAITNGALCGIGFFISGIPNAMFWGAIMTFSSVIPLVGTALIWIPSAIYLIITGNIIQASFIMIWCSIISLVCDNWLRPKLIGKKNNLHPLFTFFAILGGINYFGLIGLIIGPLIFGILFSLLEIHKVYLLKNKS